MDHAEIRKLKKIYSMGGGNIQTSEKRIES
jgi:hypothetical protein